MEPFSDILAVVNSETGPASCLERAIELAEHDGARLKLVEVVRDYSWLERLGGDRHAKVIRQLVEKSRDSLATRSESARARGIDVETKVCVGKSSTEIVKEAIRGGHDLVMKDAKGTGWFKGFFGTTGMQLLRSCPCAVWLVKPGPHTRYQRVMAAVDTASRDELHAELNRKILDAAKSFCRREESELLIVQSWDVYGETLLKGHMEKREFDDLMKRSRLEMEGLFAEFLSLHDSSPESPGVHLLHGDPIATLPLFAERERVDLVVLGTVARTGLVGALMGNTAEAILRKVECSVLALKPAAFVSPITPED